MPDAVVKMILITMLTITTAVCGQSNIWAQARQTNHSSGTLALGSSFTGIDGVTVDASEVPGKAELIISIEKFSEENLGFSAPHFGSPVTPYYLISATPEHSTKSRAPFFIRIPLPEDMDVGGMGAIILHSGQYATDVPEDSVFWLPSSAKYLPDTHEAQLRLSILSPKGLIITIGESVY